MSTNKISGFTKSWKKQVFLQFPKNLFGKQAKYAKWDSSAMDVSAMKCEMCFPLECHQSAKVRTAVVKRVGAKFALALVPGRSSHAAFIAIHDAYHGFGSAITAYSYTDAQAMARKHDIFLD